MAAAFASWLASASGGSDWYGGLRAGFSGRYVTWRHGKASPLHVFLVDQRSSSSSSGWPGSPSAALAAVGREGPGAWPPSDPPADGDEVGRARPRALRAVNRPASWTFGAVSFENTGVVCSCSLRVRAVRRRSTARRLAHRAVAAERPVGRSRQQAVARGDSGSPAGRADLVMLLMNSGPSSAIYTSASSACWTCPRRPAPGHQPRDQVQISDDHASARLGDLGGRPSPEPASPAGHLHGLDLEAQQQH